MDQTPGAWAAHGFVIVVGFVCTYKAGFQIARRVVTHQQVCSGSVHFSRLEYVVRRYTVSLTSTRLLRVSGAFHVAGARAVTEQFIDVLLFRAPALFYQTKLNKTPTTQKKKHGGNATGSFAG